MFLEQSRARIEFSEGLARPCQFFASDLAKQSHESVERGCHMRFQATKRTEREPVEALLKFADGAPARTQIMDEIPRALKVPRRGSFVRDRQDEFAYHGNEYASARCVEVLAKMRGSHGSSGRIDTSSLGRNLIACALARVLAQSAGANPWRNGTSGLPEFELDFFA